MRRILLVLLGFGVFAGYGSAIASARWHARNHGEYAGCESRWDRDSHRGFERSDEFRPPAPAAAPQTIVMPQAAPAAAAAPQIFLIMPGAQAAPVAPQVITVPAPAAAPAQAPTPASP